MQRKTSETWRSLIESWQASDLTQKEFCAQHSIAYSGFHYWFKKFREQNPPLVNSGFVPVKLTSHTSACHTDSAQIELVLPDGRSVKFYNGVDVQFLRTLLS